MWVGERETVDAAQPCRVGVDTTRTSRSAPRGVVTFSVDRQGPEGAMWQTTRRLRYRVG